MSRTSRALSAVALALALAVPLACGDDGTETSFTGTTVPSPTTTSTTTTTTAPTTTTEVDATVIDITVSDGKVTGGGRKQVTKDERVTLRVTSDKADEIHVHGYDISVDINANERAELTFTPNAEGVYEVELEDAGIELLELEVR
jgi:heme/copper-type cytochrome/quinol oxidase subunit 2